jgi:hypothetical protein
MPGSQKMLVDVAPQGYVASGWGQFLLWFIIIAVIAWFILYSFKPVWVQKTNAQGQPTGEADPCKTLFAAIIIALIVIILIWLLRSCGRC